MKHIAFTIDKKFLRFCAVTMVSILKNDTPKDLTFHIIANDLTPNDKSILKNQSEEYGANICFYEVADSFLLGYHITWESQRLPMVVFYRCILASILPLSVKKVLYLDCDTLVLQPLDDLWNLDLTGKAVAAIPDDYFVNEKHCKRLAYDCSFNYFNGGVLLLNLEYWRQYHIEQSCKNYFKQNQDKIVYNDQDLLNGLLHENVLLADMKWNVQENAYRVRKGFPIEISTKIRYTILHPSILHYSARKPWQFHCMHPLRNLFYEYQALTIWKDENILNHIIPRIHRFLHFLPYTLRLKKSKYIDLNKYISL